MIEGSWKGMKKYLEQNMLCVALRNRVTYHYEVYNGSLSACFIVALDGKTVKKFSLYYAMKKLREQGYRWNAMGHSDGGAGEI